MQWYFYGRGRFSFLGAFIAYNDFVEFALMALAAKFVGGGEALICGGFAPSFLLLLYLLKTGIAVSQGGFHPSITFCMAGFFTFCVGEIIVLMVRSPAGLSLVGNALFGCRGLQHPRPWCLLVAACLRFGLWFLFVP